MDASEQLLASDNPVPDAEEAFAKRGCCCFWIPLSSPSWLKAWERVPQAANAEVPPGAPTGISRRSWVGRVLKAFTKVRERSELVSVPNCKTFIRRHGRNRSDDGRFRYGGKFGYDPLSYARNFDEGEDSGFEGDGVRRAFSSRYVAPSLSTKSSMDLGGRDAPPLLQEGY